VGATAADVWTPLATTRIATSLRPQVEQAVPVAARIISSLREIGYELRQAVADPMDNSVAARATKVPVDLDQPRGGGRRQGTRPAAPHGPGSRDAHR
jgi:hypothetical protein